MNEKIKKVHEESIDEMLRNLSPLQQIKKLKELLLDSYDTSYDLARRMVKAIKYINENFTFSDGTLGEQDIKLLEILKGDDE